MGYFRNFEAWWLAGLLVAGAVPSRANECKDTLVQGVRNQYNLASQQNVQTVLADAVCNGQSNLASGSGGSGGGVTLSIHGYPVSLIRDYQLQRVDEMRSRYCANRKEDLNEDDLSWLSRQVVAGGIISAWANCMIHHSQGSNAQGVHSSLGSIGDQLSFEAYFSDPFHIGKLPVIEEFYVEGATCSPPPTFNPGGDLDIMPMIQPCKREGNGPVVIVLSTSMGDVSQTLNAASATPPVQFVPQPTH